MLLGDALGAPGDVSIEDLFSDKHYLSKATEVHAVAMQRAGAKTITRAGRRPARCLNASPEVSPMPR